MQLQTILNKVQKFKGYVYENVTLSQDGKKLDVLIRPRSGSSPTCSDCGRKGPVYDHLPKARRFEFVPLWQIAVFFVCVMRRVDCRHCKRIVVEQVPWSDGKHHTTLTYRWFLAEWGRRLSWSETAAVFRTSWQTVFRSVRYAVMWGIANNSWENVTAIGIDEIAWKKGHKYLTLVYQINEGGRRLLFVAQERTKESLAQFFRMLKADKCQRIEYVVSDMWRNYLDVVQEFVPNAVHVLDRFHVMKKFNEALDEIRREETRELRAAGYEPVLRKARWCLLKRPENLTDRQTTSLREILKHNLKTVRAWLSREDFQRFWEYSSPAWAGKFLDEWTDRTMRTRLQPLMSVAEMLRRHKPLLLNWFRARGEFSAGCVEGMNGKAKLTMKKAYGFKSYNVAEVALLHTLGKLPTPEVAHRFW
jgi:transposase